MIDRDVNTEEALARSRRDDQIVVFETIGCALAVLRRLNHVWYDEDIRERITAARAALSVTQSMAKQRIDESFVERILP